MPTILNNEILAAAIEGFEVQKKRIDADCRTAATNEWGEFRANHQGNANA
jgi:hypothetical protein